MATKVYVENVPCTISEERLKDVFSQIGAVESVKLETDILRWRNKCSGYVEMSLDVDAYRAVNCFNGATFRDRKIYVKEEMPFLERARELVQHRIDALAHYGSELMKEGRKLH